MTGMINIVKLVFQLIKSPIKTIKGAGIISYDKDAMLRLFAIVSAAYVIVTFSLLFERFNPFAIILFIIVSPFFMFLVFSVTVVLYYVSFKLLGKGIEANYDGVKTAFYPLFLTSMIINIFNLLIAHISPFLIIILRYAANLWFYAVVFFLLVYKLRQTRTRSILISLLPLFIGIIIEFLSTATRM